MNIAPVSSTVPFLSLLLGLLTAGAAQATPTEITVRVLSRDAKFVGSSMGGAQIVIRGGLTVGSTGDTKRAMHTDGGRRALLAADDAAAFNVTLDLAAPQLLEVEARGPMAQLQSAVRVTASQWVIPGRHLNGGHGWVLEMPGFVVDILAPPAHIKLKGAVTEIELRANVSMMCGCPIEPGGMWNADHYEVRALVQHDDGRVKEVALRYAGETSQFAAPVPLDLPGLYAVTVYAYDPLTGNTGLDRTTFLVP
jgi:hypothetical protein